MLALTEDACSAIEGILEKSQPGAGIRIAPTPEEQDGASRLAMSVAPAPAQDDQRIASEGGPVYVDSAAQPFLEDKVLDATVSPDGVQFEILTQQA